MLNLLDAPVLDVDDPKYRKTSIHHCWKTSRFPSSTFGHVRLVRQQTTINGREYINPDETELTDVLNNTF